MAKAFESTTKVMCDTHDWEYSKNDTAKKLIRACLDNGLIPEYMQNQLFSFQELLESGTPRVRNKVAAHGAGTKEKGVTEALARYALHLGATNILFLLDVEKELYL